MSDVAQTIVRQEAAGEVCANCGAPRAGAYCTDCGQQFLDERLSLRQLWREFAQRYLKLERGLLLTFRQMFTDPGGVARRYVEGQRRRYLNPLSYFLVGATVALLMYTLLGDRLLEAMEVQVRQQFEADPRNAEVFSDIFGEDPVRGYVGLVFGAIKSAYTYLMLLLVLPLAGLLRLLRSETGYTVAETTVFALYVVGHAIILTSVLMPLTVAYGAYVGMMIGIGVFILYAVYASRGFYGPTLQNMLLTVVAMIGAYGVYVVAIGILIMGLVLYQAFQVEVLGAGDAP